MSPSKQEIKNGILAQINQMAVAALIEQAADLAVENTALKEKLDALEKRVTEIVKSRDGPMDV